MQNCHKVYEEYTTSHSQTLTKSRKRVSGDEMNTSVA